jgi:uncharacterized membrane protein
MRKTWIAAAVYACVFGGLEWYRWHVWSFGSDTGTFTQAILATANGFRDGPEGTSHFYFHFSPILALLFPVVAASRSPLSLQLAQVVLCALTAPMVYSLFKPYVDERVAFRLALLTLAYPPLASIAFGEFHELAFFPVLCLGLLWAADRCRWGWFAAFGVACLLTREDVCLELAAVGFGICLFSVLRRNTAQHGLILGEPRRPLATAAAFACLGFAGCLVALSYYHEVLALYGRWPHNHFYDYAFANGPLAVAAALLTQPGVALPQLLRIGRLTYLIEALAPLLLLPARSAWSLAAVPGLVVVLLASEQSVWRMGNHYAAMWAPWLLVATGAALANVERRKSARTALAWENAAIAACAVVLLAFNPMHVSHYLTPPYRDLPSAAAAIACVPPDAGVSTHDEWFSEMAADYPNATILAVDEVQYLVYADDFPNERFARVMLPQLQANVSSGRYKVVCTFGHVKTYRRAR